MSDPGNYRTRAEIEKYQERDPLKLFATSLKEERVLSDDELQRMDAEVRKEVEDSVKFAEESPLPAPEELYTEIYANPIEPGNRN